MAGANLLFTFYFAPCDQCTVLNADDACAANALQAHPWSYLLAMPPQQAPFGSLCISPVPDDEYQEHDDAKT